MPARALAASLVLVPPFICLATALVGQPAPGRVTVRYTISSEDEPATSGRLTLPIQAAGTSTGVVWEGGCRLASALVDAPPREAEQFWTFTVDLTRDSRGQPAARLRYRHTSADARPSAEVTRVLSLDGSDPLALNELSSRTDCPYDRIHLTAAGDQSRSARDRNR